MSMPDPAPAEAVELAVDFGGVCVKAALRGDTVVPLHFAGAVGGAGCATQAVYLTPCDAEQAISDALTKEDAGYEELVHAISRRLDLDPRLAVGDDAVLLAADSALSFDLADRLEAPVLRMNGREVPPAVVLAFWLRRLRWMAGSEDKRPHRLHLIVPSGQLDDRRLRAAAAAAGFSSVRISAGAAAFGAAAALLPPMPEGRVLVLDLGGRGVRGHWFRFRDGVAVSDPDQPAYAAPSAAAQDVEFGLLGRVIESLGPRFDSTDKVRLLAALRRRLGEERGPIVVGQASVVVEDGDIKAVVNEVYLLVLRHALEQVKRHIDAAGPPDDSSPSVTVIISGGGAALPGVDALVKECLGEVHWLPNPLLGLAGMPISAHPQERAVSGEEELRCRARSGEPLAAFELGSWLLSKDTDSTARDEAIGWLESAVAAGVVPAMTKLARARLGDVTFGAAGVTALLERAAGQSDPEAMALLGTLLAGLDGDRKDYPNPNRGRAWKLLSQAEEAGSIEAKFALGRLAMVYEPGGGSPKLERAGRLLREAGEAGWTSAWRFLGELKAGSNFNEAVGFWEQAIRMGDRQVGSSIATVYPLPMRLTAARAAHIQRLLTMAVAANDAGAARFLIELTTDARHPLSFVLAFGGLWRNRDNNPVARAWLGTVGRWLAAAAGLGLAGIAAFLAITLLGWTGVQAWLVMVLLVLAVVAVVRLALMARPSDRARFPSPRSGTVPKKKGRWSRAGKARKEGSAA